MTSIARMLAATTVYFYFDAMLSTSYYYYYLHVKLVISRNTMYIVILGYLQEFAWSPYF